MADESPDTTPDTAPEPTQFTYRHADLVALLVKQADIHEGFWQLSVTFGFAATNGGVSQEDLNPTAIIPILGVGIQKVPAKASNLVVDAAEVNPKP